MKEGDQELIDKYQVQMKQQAQRKKDRINELKEKAPTDPRAAEELAKCAGINIDKAKELEAMIKEL